MKLRLSGKAHTESKSGGDWNQITGEFLLIIRLIQCRSDEHITLYPVILLKRNTNDSPSPIVATVATYVSIRCPVFCCVVYFGLLW